MMVNSGYDGYCGDVIYHGYDYDALRMIMMVVNCGATVTAC